MIWWKPLSSFPRDTFYTTDISVTLWILNKNKKQRTDNTKEKPKNYRDRSGEILFMDLRRWGSEYEKKYIELTEDDVEQVALNYHNWQQVGYEIATKTYPNFANLPVLKI
jgi:type I restriction enzyme M protein